MLKLASILLALLVASEQAAPPRAGIMVTTAGRGVLAMDGPPMAPGTIITLVTIDNPQQVSRARISDRLTDPEIMAKHMIPPPYYAVTPMPASNALPNLAVAIMGQFEGKQSGSAVILRADKAASQIRVRSCASSEGLHFTLWASEPLKGKRLWHLYYYLGYDVVPTCQEADY